MRLAESVTIARRDRRPATDSDEYDAIISAQATTDMENAGRPAHGVHGPWALEPRRLRKSSTDCYFERPVVISRSARCCAGCGEL